MDPDLLLGVGGLVLVGLTYFAGRYTGARDERERRRHDSTVEEDRRLHELSTRVVDQYCDWATSHYDSGVHALARLALHRLRTDERVRDAIRVMNDRTGRDPLGRYRTLLEGVDLVRFFDYVADNRVDFNRTSVEVIAAAVRPEAEREEM